MVFYSFSFRSLSVVVKKYLLKRFLLMSLVYLTMLIDIDYYCYFISGMFYLFTWPFCKHCTGGTQSYVTKIEVYLDIW